MRTDDTFVRLATRLLAELDDGDVVIVTGLDRLARSARDLLNTLAIGAANASFRSLHDAWRTPPRRTGG